MTVRDVCKIIKTAKAVEVVVLGCTYPVWQEGSSGYNDVLLDAFGDYVVNEVFATREDRFEIEIVMRPMKKEDIACTN